jgi:hypothetical protein
MDLDIESTKIAIFTSLEILRSSGSCLNIDFITKERLERPPFPFIHALVTIYCRHLSFASGLYDEAEFEIHNVKSRQDKIRFLFKILACVAKVTKERVDVYVSPVNILGGQEVAATLTLLRCLAKASKVSHALSASFADEIVKTGVSDLYKKSVHARNNIIIIQATIRGRFTRRKQVQNKMDFNSTEGANDADKVHITTFNLALENASIKEKISPDTSDDECERDDAEISKGAIALCNEMHITSSPQPIALVALNKDEICSAVRKLKKEETGKVSFNSNDATSSEGLVQATILVKPAATITTLENTINLPVIVKKVKKCKVVDGIVTCQTLEVREAVQEEEERMVKIKTIQEMEVECKRKLRRLKVREAKLDGRIEEINQKEELLQIHDERVKRLAENLRKQQDKVKEDGLRQAIELDKLRLETSYRPHELRGLPDPIRREFHFGEDLLKQACDNPTITDLRLALERKERSLTKRNERMVKAEKVFRQRIAEFEESKTSALQEQSENAKFQTIVAPPVIPVQKKKKKQQHNEKDKSADSEHNAAPMLDLVTETYRRRQTFAPATVPDELEQKHASLSESLSSKDLNKEVPPLSHLAISISNGSLLSTITEEADVKQSAMRRRKTLPRSLVSYSNNRQNYVALGT